MLVFKILLLFPIFYLFFFYWVIFSLSYYSVFLLFFLLNLRPRNRNTNKDSLYPRRIECLNCGVLESPLDCKEIQPVHSEGDQPGISLEGMMLKLKLQYFGHLMETTDSLEKTLRLGKIEGRRRRGQQRMRWLGDITNSMDMSLSKLRGLK